jgi:SAM-dependent methyltransferase
MNNGWERSAQAWIASMGEQGDWARQHVLDPVMLGRVARDGYRSALDVGCGEGRFCRMLQASGIGTIGIDPTHSLLEQAKRRDPAGDYRLGSAEALPFEAASFDLVVSYLTLVDITDFRAAIREMYRVLKPAGSLLIANLTASRLPVLLTVGSRTKRDSACISLSTAISTSFHLNWNGGEYIFAIGTVPWPPTCLCFSKSVSSSRISRSRKRLPATAPKGRYIGGCHGLSSWNGANLPSLFSRGQAAVTPYVYHLSGHAPTADL